MQVEILLKIREYLSNLFRRAKISDGVGDGVVVFQLEQRREFF